MLRLPRFGCSMKWFTPPAPATMPELIKPALRVTGLRVLDLDDVGAPVRQHRTGRRHERPRGEFDDADSGEDVAHADSRG